MICEEYTRSFEAVHQESRGIAATFSSDTSRILIETMENWIEANEPKTLVIRDAMHNPKAL